MMVRTNEPLEPVCYTTAGRWQTTTHCKLWTNKQTNWLLYLLIIDLTMMLAAPTTKCQMSRRLVKSKLKISRKWPNFR